MMIQEVTHWWFFDAQYPEEGSQGPFETLEEARIAASLQDYDPEDEDAVCFVHGPSKPVQDRARV